MSEMKSTHGAIGVADKKLAEFGWRRGALGVGTFLFVVALFMSAGAKGALGVLPAYVAGAGLLLMVASIVAGIVDWVSAKQRARHKTPA